MIQFDAASIKARIIDRLKSKTSWADVLFYSTNNRLIDIFAEELAYDNQYNEMLTREGKWNLARQISSLMAETQFFNYYPHRKKGSSGYLKISTSKTFNASYALNIEIPKFSVFSNGDLSFAVSETTTLLNTENYILAPIIQGKPKTETYIALGDVYEVVTILNDSIENSLLSVYVNGTEWTAVNNIREADGGEDKVFEVRNLNDFSGVTIKFGNDYFGKKLVSGDAVVVQYLETAGSNSNVESANIITNVDSVFVDTDGVEVELFCTNDASIIGGTDREELESIRAKAPKTYQTGDRAISKDDYKSILESFGFIKKGVAWGEAETNDDLGNIPGTYLPLEENVVHLSAITNSDGQLTDSQISEVRKVLNEKKPPTDIVVFEPVNFIYIDFIVTFYVSNKKYTLTYVRNLVTENLKSTYSIDSLDFKKNIRYSDYTSLIDSTEGVEYHDTIIKMYKFETFNTAYSADIKIELENITPGTIQIYARDLTINTPYTQIAHDDSAGNFVGDAGYTVFTSSINYNNGIGNLIVTSGLSGSFTNYSLKIIFQTDSESVIPTKRYQIVSYGTCNLTASYI